MTHEELQAIKARAEAATPGPWTSDPYDCLIADGKNICSAGMDGDDPAPIRTEDAIFIAHARTDVPALIAEVERYRGMQASAVIDPGAFSAAWKIILAAPDGQVEHANSERAKAAALIMTSHMRLCEEVAQLRAEVERLKAK